MKYRVLYMLPGFFRDGIMGRDWLVQRGMLPNIMNLEATHNFVKEIEAPDAEAAWMAMQAENWSPNGEARDLIKNAGLQHTSMSVGDILIDERNKVWMADRFGFTEIAA